MRSELTATQSTRRLSRVEKKWQSIRVWEGDSTPRKRIVYLGCYTVAFFIVAFITLFVYPSNGRAIIWNIDGLDQYYPFFVYEGQWLREIVGALAAGQGLQIPLWSYNLGYGMDIPSTLDVFYDPLNLLSGLCPEHLSEYLFQFLVVFRLYLAGIAFSLLSLRFNLGRFNTLIGSLLYALCATALAVAYWPASAWPLILFPLLLLGVEKVLAGERPYVFIVSVAAFFVISYYFSYMACLMLIPYCAVRVIQTQKDLKVARFALWTLQFLGLLVLGVLIACFALVPSLTGLIGLDRITNSQVDVPLFYPIRYYLTTVSGFLSFSSVGSDCYIGFGGIAFLSCVLLFSHRKQNTSLKIVFIAASVMLLLPAFGSLFNGLNYATNRWVWAYALIVCFIVTRMLPALLAPNKRTVKLLFVATVVYSVLMFLVPPLRTESILAAVAVLVFSLFVFTQAKTIGTSTRVSKAGALCCLVVSLVVNTFYFVSPEEGGVGKNSPPLGYAYTRLTADAPNHLVSDLDDEGLWRYDGSPSSTDRTRNDSLVLGLKGIDFYNSSYNNLIDDYHTELALNKTNINFSYKNLGGRTILESLAGVKYYLSTEKDDPLLYLYDNPANMVSSGFVHENTYRVYEGSNILPLAFVYDSFLPRAHYLKLSPTQRQEALMQGVVLEDSLLLPQTKLVQESQIMPSTISQTDGVVVDNGVILVTKPNSKLTISFEGIVNSETYFYIDQLSYEPLSPFKEAQQMGMFDKQPWYKQAIIIKKDIEWSPSPKYGISLTSDKSPGSRTIENYTEKSHLYGGKDEWLVNMGYSKEAQTSITLCFSNTGTYNFDNLSVICQPMDNVSSRIDNLKADPVENLTFTTNRIAAHVELDRAKALFFSVPYSKGWTATVDGKPFNIQRANTAFMALELDAGSHEVELHYMTPGLPEGLILSGIGLAALVALLCFYRFRSDGEKGRLCAQPTCENGLQQCRPNGGEDYTSSQVSVDKGGEV